VTPHTIHVGTPKIRASYVNASPVIMQSMFATWIEIQVKRSSFANFMTVKAKVFLKTQRQSVLMEPI
jgi:hypothetical protein